MPKWIFTLAFLFILNLKMMAQNEILFQESAGNTILSYTDSQCLKAANILKENLDKISLASFKISSGKEENGIVLEIFESKGKDFFEINSDTQKITLRATSPAFLEYSVYSLLEYWEIRKFTPDYTYYPELEVLKYPKNKKIKEQPAFDFRGILYPGIYDTAFRKWHKTDWFQDDFGLWGHTFDKLVPAKEYFKENPKMFALYDHKRRSESICYSNDTVFRIMKNNIAKAIQEKPNATYFSISQNDDEVYCECSDCQKLHQKYGLPQGAHYYFLNQVAKQFPKVKIATLAYLFSYQPPKNLILASNLYPIVCPIDANRGEALNEGKNNGIKNVLQKWARLSKNVMFWDYTVEFSNYLSPFPNFYTFSPNYTFLHSIGIKGIFSQGYADVPGSFCEFRQYLLAKLLWDPTLDVREISSDFLRGYYGKASPFVQEYLEVLTKNQKESNTWLDIFSNPVAQRNSFLSPENMALYDNLLSKADNEGEDTVIKKRIKKLRLDLEYVFFEQAKFYGKEPHGMYQKKEQSSSVKDNLETRVQDFTKNCTEFGIYELSEGGISPEEYLAQWKYIARNNVIDHLGENLKYEFVTQPASDYNAKKEKGLNDGIKGYKDFNINWTGWYGQNAELTIDSNNTDFNTLEFQCLEDQRHWIFLPEKIILKGLRNSKWETIKEQTNEELTENYNYNIRNYNFDNISFRIFDKIKIILINERKVPAWRERKNKKPMVMTDEIVLLKK